MSAEEKTAPTASMNKKDILGRRCTSNAFFASQFHRTIVRNKGRPLEGMIIADDDLVTVKWDTLKTPWRLVREFLIIKDGDGGERVRP